MLLCLRYNNQQGYAEYRTLSVVCYDGCYDIDVVSRRWMEINVRLQGRAEMSRSGYLVLVRPGCYSNGGVSRARRDRKVEVTLQSGSMNNEECRCRYGYI
jgi:hypothetical protein